MAEHAPHLLIIDARFYEDLAEELAEGASAAIKAAGGSFDHISVPGAFEIPAAMAMAVAAMEQGGTRYDGFVLLGCVIRGETSHYDIVAGESARAIMELAVNRRLAVGNGILTVDHRDQAWARAKVSGKNKGGGAAEAALAMIETRRRFGLDR